MPLTVTDRLFTGQRWDATIGLYDYGNSSGIAGRFYDPEIGTFIQPDSNRRKRGIRLTDELDRSVAKR